MNHTTFHADGTFTTVQVPDPDQGPPTPAEVLAAADPEVVAALLAAITPHPRDPLPALEQP